MQVHLVDGTYELFRYHFALPSHVTADGQEVAATRGVAGRAADARGGRHPRRRRHRPRHRVVPQRPVGRLQGRAGIEPELLSQFPLVEELLEALGVTVFAMVEYEADDALGAAAAIAAADERVEQVLICTPDKDLGQCVGGKVVQLDRRKGLDQRRDGRAREVRRAARVDPRLPRPRGRHRRRLPRPARLGRQVRRRGAGPLRPPRGHPARRRRLGHHRPRRAPSWRDAAASSSTTRCCSAASPPSSTTRPTIDDVDELRVDRAPARAGRRGRPARRRHAWSSGPSRLAAKRSCLTRDRVRSGAAIRASMSMTRTACMPTEV